jgi:hypothetical protein
MKQTKLNFREITSLYINDIKKVKCSSNSPQCLLSFIPTREKQKMCVKCLIHLGILEKHPLLDVSKGNYKKIKIITTSY